MRQKQLLTSQLNCFGFKGSICLLPLNLFHVMEQNKRLTDTRTIVLLINKQTNREVI